MPSIPYFALGTLNQSGQPKEGVTILVSNLTTGDIDVGSDITTAEGRFTYNLANLPNGHSGSDLIQISFTNGGYNYSTSIGQLGATNNINFGNLFYSTSNGWSSITSNFPTNFRKSNLSNGILNLRWDAQPNVVQYNVYKNSVLNKRVVEPMVSLPAKIGDFFEVSGIDINGNETERSNAIFIESDGGA